MRWSGENVNNYKYMLEVGIVDKVDKVDIVDIVSMNMKLFLYLLH